MCASLLAIAVVSAIAAVVVLASEAVWREDARHMRRLARQRDRFRLGDDGGAAAAVALRCRVRAALTTDRADVTIAGLLGVLSLVALAGALTY